MQFAPLKLLFLLLAAAAVFAHPAPAADRILLAHLFEESTAHHQEALWAAEEAAKRTNGRYVMEVLGNGTLGSSDTQHMEAVKAGTVDMTYLGFSHVADTYGPLSIGAGPYIFRDYNHWLAFGESPLFQELRQGYERASGLRVLGMVYYGQRHITSKKPVRSLQDLKGMPIRSGPMPTIMKTLQLLGAKPVLIPFHEVYQALKSGIVEAQENPLPTIRAMKFYEVANVITLTGHFTDGQLVLFNGPKWEALPEADRKVLAEVFLEVSRRVSDNTRRQEIELVKTFRDMGVTVNEIDTAPFREAVRPALTSDVFPWGRAIYDRLQAIQ
jgi:tripartite ATP-independent transporter DctP family solute receptor